MMFLVRGKGIAMKRKMYRALVFLALILGPSAYQAERMASAAQGRKQPIGVPMFEGDPFWPKPLPSSFFLGEVGGVYFDSQDHVWIISRPRTLINTGDVHYTPAPPVIEFDAAGNYIQGWGGPGPGYEW